MVKKKKQNKTEPKPKQTNKQTKQKTNKRKNKQKGKKHENFQNVCMILYKFPKINDFFVGK